MPNTLARPEPFRLFSLGHLAKLVYEGRSEPYANLREVRKH